MWFSRLRRLTQSHSREIQRKEFAGAAANWNQPTHFNIWVNLRETESGERDLKRFTETWRDIQRCDFRDRNVSSSLTRERLKETSSWVLRQIGINPHTLTFEYDEPSHTQSRTLRDSQRARCTNQPTHSNISVLRTLTLSITNSITNSTWQPTGPVYEVLRQIGIKPIRGMRGPLETDPGKRDFMFVREFVEEFEYLDVIELVIYGCQNWNQAHLRHARPPRDWVTVQAISCSWWSSWKSLCI